MDSRSQKTTSVRINRPLTFLDRIIKLYNCDLNQGLNQVSRTIKRIQIFYTICGGRPNFAVPFGNGFFSQKVEKW